MLDVWDLLDHQEIGSHVQMERLRLIGNRAYAPAEDHMNIYTYVRPGQDISEAIQLKGMDKWSWSIEGSQVSLKKIHEC